MGQTLPILLLALLGATAFCSAAEPEKKPLPPAGTTNFFSNWMVASNLTVKSPGSPWGGTKRSFVGIVGPGGTITKAPPTREVLEAMAQLHRRNEERRERERLERLLKGPPLSDQYHVHLERAPDHSTNAPAN